MSLFADARNDDFYNTDFLGKEDTEFIKGFDFAIEQLTLRTVKTVGFPALKRFVKGEHLCYNVCMNKYKKRRLTHTKV